jgi:hypothetical protein
LLVHWEYASEERLAVRNKTFPDRESMRRFVAATITRAHLADQVPEINKPFRARTSHVVLVARKAA